MEITRAFKSEIKPTVEQRRMLEQHAGVARFSYNWALAEWDRQYHEGGKPNKYALRKDLTKLKDSKLSWIGDVSSYVPREAVYDLGTAYQNAFRRIREGAKGKKAIGWPKRKKKGKTPRHFHIDQGDSIKVEAGRVLIPKIGWVKLARQGYLPTNVVSDLPIEEVTRKNSKGKERKLNRRVAPSWPQVKVNSLSVSQRGKKWFASVNMSYTTPDPEKLTGPVLGVDVGVRVLAAVYDGEKDRLFAGERQTQEILKCEKKLRLWQRRMSRRQHMVKGPDGKPLKGPGGRNVYPKEKTQGFFEAKAEVAKYNARLACLRSDLLHKTSRRIVDLKPSLVVIEDLNIRGMMANPRKNRRKRGLSRVIAHAGLGEFHRQLSYKLGWARAEVLKANKFFASSKRCSKCGSYLEDLGSKKVYRCPTCGNVLHRDSNSGRNLRAYGLNPKDFDVEVTQRQACLRRAGGKPSGQTDGKPSASPTRVSEPDNLGHSSEGCVEVPVAGNRVPELSGRKRLDRTQPAACQDKAHDRKVTRSQPEEGDQPSQSLPESARLLTPVTESLASGLVTDGEGFKGIDTLRGASETAIEGSRELVDRSLKSLEVG